MLQKKASVSCCCKLIKALISMLTDHVLRPPSREIMHIPIFSCYPCTRHVHCSDFGKSCFCADILGLGLLQNLDDCGSPPLASRAQTLTRPNSLRTSDRKSMMAYMGLPLDLFGNVSVVPIFMQDCSMEFSFIFAGCFLPALFAPAAA